MEDNSYEYTSFPRQFLTYKWFKPLLVGLLVIIFSMIFSAAFLGIGYLLSGGDTMTFQQSQDRDNPLFYQGAGLIMGLGSVAVMIPALALAALIVRDRPFSSYSSSRGGFNWGAYFKYLVVSFIVLGILIVPLTIFFPDGSGDGINKFSILGIAALAILVFFQGAAEEYIYRGLIMQAVGSWTNLPVVAIVVSSLIFAFSHSYSPLGIAAVFIDGMTLAYIAWRTRGLEVSCAVHGAHNFIVLLLSGLGMASSGSADLITLIQVIVINAVLVAVVILVEKKFHWCKPKGDGVSEYNEKHRVKMEAKKQF